MLALYVVEAIATICWVYAGLTLISWGKLFSSLEKREHVAAITDLLSHLVPAALIAVVIVIFASVLGFPSAVVLIAFVFPAGLAYGGHMALTDLREAGTSAELDLQRLLLTFVIASAIIAYRQII